jgi:Xaa-Pro aminopeptidase
MTGPERLAAVRSLMARNKVDAYVVPSTDPHASEYVAETWQRRGFISGFDGSAGTFVVTADQAGLWTDGRYFLQAEEQLAGTGIELFKMGVAGVPDVEPWLAMTLSGGERVGVDPAVFTAAAYSRLKSALTPAGIELTSVSTDLVELVWGESRPMMPDAGLRVHPMEFAGQTVSDKLLVIADRLQVANADALVIGALDEVAWFFNLRGADVDFNPVFIAYAVIEKDEARLFVDLAKVTTEVRDALPGNVMLQPYEAIGDYLKNLGETLATVWMDPATVNEQVRSGLESAGAKTLLRTSPIPSWKSAKNDAEIAGSKAAHVRDGVAMVRFLRWLKEAVPKGEETELTVWDKLLEFRKVQDKFIGLSFNSIVGYGPHGAIVHYAVSHESCSDVREGDLLLVDSGGQYLDGTTDITRTVALGEPTAEHRLAYTTVLKGHLNLGRAWFPEGVDGYQLDALARAPLWAQGFNYAHGTGHGVGASLCVHEGPFSVSHRKVLVPMQVGNVLSNEPGHYVTGSYGIRIENLVLTVVKADTDSGHFIGFENLTMCPYDRSLIDVNALSEAELKQVDDYHQTVFETLSPFLTGSDLEFLRAATNPL